MKLNVFTTKIQCFFLLILSVVFSGMILEKGMLAGRPLFLVSIVLTSKRRLTDLDKRHAVHTYYLHTSLFAFVRTKFEQVQCLAVYFLILICQNNKKR